MAHACLGDSHGEEQKEVKNGKGSPEQNISALKPLTSVKALVGATQSAVIITSKTNHDYHTIIADKSTSHIIGTTKRTY